MPRMPTTKKKDRIDKRRSKIKDSELVERVDELWVELGRLETEVKKDWEDHQQKRKKKLKRIKTIRTTLGALGAESV